jgi:hypothetical protein
MWLQHDGVPLYFSRAVMEFLNKDYEWKWIESWTSGLVHSVSRLKHTIFLSVGLHLRVIMVVNLKQGVSRGHRWRVVSEKNWDACSGNIQRHNGWQHACSLIVCISNTCYNSLET